MPKIKQDKICLDIFKLHDPKKDKKPNSWICVSGKNLHKSLNEIINRINWKPTKDLMAKLIKDTRITMQFSKKELARKLNVHITTINSYEKGIKRPSLENLIKLNKILNYNQKIDIILHKYKNVNKWYLTKAIAKELKCSHSPIIERLSGRKKEIPIPVLIIFLKIIKKHLPIKFYNKLCKSIFSSITQLNVNTNGSKRTKAPKFLSIELCKICGAHAADGSITVRYIISSKRKEDLEKLINHLRSKTNLKLNITFDKNFKEYRVWIGTNELSYIKNSLNIATSYSMRIVDNDLKSIENYQKWMKKCFGINYIIKKSKQFNMYQIDINNKIICRYLIKIFNFEPGKKFETVKEPKIIKKSGLEYRVAFALGVLTFDGSVELDKTVSLNSNSKFLLHSVYEILRKSLPNTIKITLKNKKIKVWKGLQDKEFKLLLKFFEKETGKWNRLHAIAYGFSKKVKDYDEAIQLLEKYESNAVSNKITFIDILKMMEDKKQIWHANSLCENIKLKKGYNKLGLDAIYKRIYLLKRMNIITIKKYRSITKSKITGRKRAYFLNNDILTWRLPT